MICGHNSSLDITETDCVLCEVRIKAEKTWGLSGYRALRWVVDSRGPVLAAGLSLNK
jgi:hypothetical protein